MHAFQTISAFSYRELIPIIKIDINITELIVNASHLTKISYSRSQFSKYFQFRSIQIEWEERKLAMDYVEDEELQMIPKSKSKTKINIRALTKGINFFFFKFKITDFYVLTE